MSALPHAAPRSRGAPDAPPRSRTAPRRPSLRVVERRRRLHWVGLMLALVIAGVLTVVALQAQAASAAFEARSLEQELVDLRHRHEQLVSEVASLQSPERLRRIAVNDLGMVPADDPVYLDLSGPGRLTSDTTARDGDMADPVKARGRGLGARR